MMVEILRMMEGGRAPTEEEMATFIEGPAREAWTRLRRFLAENYDIVPEMLFDKKGGWDARYRKGGRTLITLTPESNAVRVLIVLGKEEVEKALALSALSERMTELIKETKQFHDGRWLWIRLRSVDEVGDVEKLVMLKKKPMKKDR